MEDQIERLAADVRSADTVVAFTGAGVSTASGIPDFRSEDGIWERYDTRQFHVRAFERDPASFWERMLDLFEEAFAGEPEPNDAHRALAELERTGHLDAVVTQNGDGLHREAGSEEVLQLHGTMGRTICPSCGRNGDVEAVRESRAAGDLPPTCDRCGEPLKPDGVLFGEPLPERELLEARSLAGTSDVFVVAGSSLTVEPAAGLPRSAVESGATLAIVNLEPTQLDDLASYTFRADVTTVLPRVADAVLASDP